MLPSERAPSHGRVRRGARGRPSLAEGGAAPPSLLAYHWYARETSPAPCRPASTRPGEAAQAVYGYAEAAQLLEASGRGLAARSRCGKNGVGLDLAAVLERAPSAHSAHGRSSSGGCLARRGAHARRSRARPTARVGLLTQRRAARGSASIATASGERSVEAVALLPLGAPERAAALSSRAASLPWCCSPISPRPSACRQSVERPGRLRRPPSPGRRACDIGSLALFSRRGDHDAGLATAEQALTLAVEAGDERYRGSRANINLCDLSPCSRPVARRSLTSRQGVRLAAPPRIVERRRPFRHRHSGRGAGDAGRSGTRPRH